MRIYLYVHAYLYPCVHIPTYELEVLVLVLAEISLAKVKSQGCIYVGRHVYLAKYGISTSVSPYHFSVLKLTSFPEDSDAEVEKLVAKIFLCLILPNVDFFLLHAGIISC